MIFGGVHNMLEAFIHAVLLALGLILPLGVQNVFVFNQGDWPPCRCRGYGLLVWRRPAVL